MPEAIFKKSLSKSLHFRQMKGVNFLGDNPFFIFPSELLWSVQPVNVMRCLCDTVLLLKCIKYGKSCCIFTVSILNKKALIFDILDLPSTMLIPADIFHQWFLAFFHLLFWDHKKFLSALLTVPFWRGRRQL